MADTVGKAQRGSGEEGNENRAAWLVALYSEGWAQYAHQNSLGQVRSNLYLTVNAGLIAIMAALGSMFLRAGTVEVGGQSINIGAGALGFSAMVFGVLANRLLVYWRYATRAGQAYVQLRRIQLRAIEDEMGLGGVSLARMEEAWRDWCRDNPGQPYLPFATRGDDRTAVPSLPVVSGWESIIGVIDVLRLFWSVVAGVGAVTLLVTVVAGIR